MMWTVMASQARCLRPRGRWPCARRRPQQGQLWVARAGSALKMGRGAKGVGQGAGGVERASMTWAVPGQRSWTAMARGRPTRQPLYLDDGRKLKGGRGVGHGHHVEDVQRGVVQRTRQDRPHGGLMVACHGHHVRAHGRREGTGEFITIEWTLQDGSTRTTRAECGKDLLEIAHENEFNLEGACAGSVACSTCHVYIEVRDGVRLPMGCAIYCACPWTMSVVCHA